jgi:hypothetical protein
MSYHTAYPNWDCPAFLPFVSTYIPSYVHQQLRSLDVKILYITTLWCFLPILGHLLVQGFIFERGPTVYKIV